MNPKLSLALFSALLFAACSKESPAHPTGTHTHADGTVHKDEAPGHGGHGEEVALGEGFLSLAFGLENPHCGKPRAEQFFDPVLDIARPEPDFRLGHVHLQQPQHARRVGDVADVHGLPRRAQQDARAALLPGRGVLR